MQTANRGRAALLGIALWLLGASNNASLASSALGRILQDLRANQQALSAARADFSRSERAGTLVGVQKSEYAAFLERLAERVARNCEQLQDLGYRLQPDDPRCPHDVARPRSTPPLRLPPAETPAERTAKLDAQLNASLSDFDDRLLREQARIKAAAPRREASDSAEQDGGTSASGQRTAGQSASEWQEPQPASASRNANQPSRRTGPYGGGGRQAAAGVPPAQTLQGQDEDIVARQLREAAEQERDPELKKKLWEEYRKLRAGQAGFEH